MSDSFSSENLEFPLDCYIRIVVVDREKIREDLEKVLQDLGIVNPLEDGNRSAKGKYVTFSVDVRVSSLEMMQKIDAEIRQVSGVKMVL